MHTKKGTRVIKCTRCQRRFRTRANEELCFVCRTGQEVTLSAVAKISTWREAQPYHRSQGMYAVGECGECKVVAAIYEPADTLCQRCYDKKMTRLSLDSRKVKVECGVCKKMARPALLSENICFRCNLARLNGQGTCAGCGKIKVIWIKKNGPLCAHCYQDRRAGRALRKFIDTYDGANRSHLVTLVDAIDWEAVDERTNRKVRAFGRFLREITLPDPLTWEAIEVSMPERGSKKSYTVQLVRCALWELAYIQVANGKLEPRENYLKRRECSNLITQMPERFQHHVREYEDWLKRSRHSSSTLGDNLAALKRFFKWSDYRGLDELSEVTEFVFEEYEQFLRWKWLCRGCQNESAYDVHGPVAECSACQIPMTKARRYENVTVDTNCQRVQAFFKWAHSNELTTNSIPFKIANRCAFRHYPETVVRELAQYLTSAEAMPVEALVFYLIIFHACSLWELRHATIPIGENGEALNLADAGYLVIPDRPPSCGKLSTGRPVKRISFDPAITPWIKPLLERVDAWRLETLRGAGNRFVLVIRGRARHGRPVSNYFVQQTVKRGAARAGVGNCAPSILRMTAAVLFADSGEAGVLALLGWSKHRAHQLIWPDLRRVVVPGIVTDAIPRQPPAGALAE